MLACAILPAAPAPAPAAAAPQQADPPSGALHCRIGPIVRKLGGNDWLVYACDDRRNMVVASPPDSPAWPFFFALTPHAGSWSVEGVGDGDEKAQNAARYDLERLSAIDFAALLAEIAAADAKGKAPRP